jgi:hypothetical protein
VTRISVRAQPVDATPSSQLIRHFPMENRFARL